MKKFGIAIHGGASDETHYIKENLKKIEASLKEAVLIGYKILAAGGTALDAVETTVRYLEDSPHFNAGRGSALNCKGEVEMDASIMDGKELDAGAVSMLRSVKNPVSLARLIMQNTNHVLLSGYGALEYAINKNCIIEKDEYFITQHQYDDYLKCLQNESREEMLEKKTHGTVGAVALDQHGNLASATSTGGTGNCMPGRVGDSCMIGAGCYANNATCAVSGTGEGEALIVGVVAHTISMHLEMHHCTLQTACDEAIYGRNKNKDEIGVVSIDKDGNFGIAFSTKLMKRAWVGEDGEVHVKVY